MADIIVVRCKERDPKDGETRARCRRCRVMVWVSEEQATERQQKPESRYICTVCM